MKQIPRKGYEPVLEGHLQTTQPMNAISTATIGLGVILVGVVLWNHAASMAVFVAPILTIVVGLCVRDASAVAMATLMNYPYAAGAYFGALNGITFFPWPPLTAYEQVAREQTLTLLIAFGATLFLGIARSFQKAARTGWRTLQDIRSEDSRFHPNRFWVVFGVAMIIGLHDAFFVVQNLRSVLSSGRHTFRDEFWVGNGPFGIVLALVLGLVLVLQVAKGKHRTKSLVALCCFWLPSIIAGSRNYFSVLMLGAICVAFFAIRQRRQRVYLGLTAFMGIVAFAWLPTLWSTNELVGFNEWILPTSSYMPLILGLFTVEGLGATTLMNQWPLILPGFMRPYPVQLYAESFADRKFTNVGVAGNPWADTYDPELVVRIALFVVAYCMIFLLASLLRRVHPAVPYLAFGLMAFWGRSVFWNVAVVLIYAAVMFRLLMPLGSKRETER